MTSRARPAWAGLVLVVLALLVYLLGPGRDPSPTTAAPPAPASSPAATTSRDPETGLPLVALDRLPAEARRTVRTIDAGGPFPYRQDGVVFANREGRLPAHPSGWYHEYTVVTPGSDDRGARRLITGDGTRQLFWTADHYATFARVQR